MKAKEGDIFRCMLDELEYGVKKVVNNMAVLESQNGGKQILTAIDTLKIGAFYRKEEDNKSRNKTAWHGPFSPLFEYLTHLSTRHTIVFKGMLSFRVFEGFHSLELF